MRNSENYSLLLLRYFINEWLIISVQTLLSRYSYVALRKIEKPAPENTSSSGENINPRMRVTFRRNERNDIYLWLACKKIL